MAKHSKNISNERYLEQERNRIIPEAERKLWAEELLSSGRPIYQMDLIDILERSRNNRWPFREVEQGDRISITLPAKSLGSIEEAKEDFGPIVLESAAVRTKGLFGNMWVLDTDQGIFISGDISRELEAERQRRLDLTPLASGLAEKYAKESIDNDIRCVDIISRTALRITTDEDDPKVIPLSELKVGDRVIFDTPQINREGWYGNPEYEMLFRDVYGLDYEITSIWTDGVDAVIECGGYVVSTIDFKNEYEMMSQALLFDMKSIEDKIVAIGSTSAAPTYIVDAVKLVDPKTGDAIDINDAKNGMEVSLTGAFVGDMTHDGWTCNMQISMKATIDQVYTQDDKMAIVLQDGPILTNVVDCREKFLRALDRINFDAERGYEPPDGYRDATDIQFYDNFDSNFEYKVER